MPTYYANDLIFDIPDTLKDQTTHILTVNEDGPSPFNITIARKTIAPDENHLNDSKKRTTPVVR